MVKELKSTKNINKTKLKKQNADSNNVNIKKRKNTKKSHSLCYNKISKDRRPVSAKDAERSQSRKDHLDLNRKGTDRHAKPNEKKQEDKKQLKDTKNIDTVKNVLRAHITGKHFRTARAHRTIITK